MLEFLNFLIQPAQNIGYGGVIFLMTIESSFIPFPSELIIPPAAFLAQQGQMNVFGVITAGVLGSMIGATFNYWLGMVLGRRIIYKMTEYKIFRFILISPSKIKKAEDFFIKYGNLSTLIGRLVPVVRQLISLPAGFVKMKFSSFLWFTFLGSSIWVTILAFLGYVLGANQDLIKQYYQEASLFFLALMLVFVVATTLKKARKKNKVFLENKNQQFK